MSASAFGCLRCYGLNRTGLPRSAVRVVAAVRAVSRQHAEHVVVVPLRNALRVRPRQVGVRVEADRQRGRDASIVAVDALAAPQAEAIGRATEGIRPICGTLYHKSEAASTYASGAAIGINTR